MKVKFFAVFALMAAMFLGACGGASDADMQSAADKALKGNEATSSVTVTVKDGVATIEGEVKDDAAKAAAETAAKVEGVTSVTNNVKVAAPPPAPVASGDDGEVKTKIEEAFKKAGCDGATVEVKDGEATISGKVKADKFAECVQAAQTQKPKKLVNKLEK